MNTTKLFGIAFATAALMLASIAPSSAALSAPTTSAAAAGPVPVVILGFTFIPLVTVSTDNAIDFLNLDPVPHHPAADNGCFDAGVITGLGGTGGDSLAACGQVTIYHCQIHTFMTGVVVKA